MALKYPNDFMNKFICGHSLQIMKEIPDNSIDLIVTSPPYNIRNTSGGGMSTIGTKNSKWPVAALSEGYTEHDDNMPHDEYVKWQRDCLTEMFRIIPDDGAIFYNHKWRVQNGLLQDRSDIVDGFPVRQVIIWRRCGGINFNDNYFLPTYEVIYMICKPKFKLARKACGQGDVWDIGQELDNEHPAPFPVELPERIISSTNAKTVLDPFMGSGTTALAAQKLHRDFVGIELSPKYVELAQKRIQENQQVMDFLNF